MTPVTLTPSTRDAAQWADGLRARATAGFLALGGITEAGASALAATQLDRTWGSEQLASRELLDVDGDPTTTVFVAEVEDRGTSRLMVFDVDAPEMSDATARHLRDALVERARSRGRQCTFSVDGFNRTAALVARSGAHQLVATRMWLALPASSSGTSVELTTMTDEEYATFVDHLVEGYAADMAAAGAVDPATAREAARHQTEGLLSAGAATPGHFLLTARAPDPVGVLWLFVGEGPAGTYGFVYDVEVGAAHRGRGLGRAIMEGASAVATREGAGYVGLNVFGPNDVARSLYESMGYGIEGEFLVVPE